MKHPAEEDIQAQLDALGAAVYRGYVIQLDPRFRDISGSGNSRHLVLLETRRTIAYWDIDYMLDSLDKRITRLNY